MKNILKLAEKFEQKLQKIASFPTKENVGAVVSNSFKNLKSPLLGGLENIYTQDVIVNTMDASMQVIVIMEFNPSQYNLIVEGPLRGQITDLVKGQLEQAIQSQFQMYKVVVKVGFVPET